MKTALKSSTILSGIGLTLTLLYSTIGNASGAQDVWFQVTSDSSCGNGILWSSELGQGKRWQITNRLAAPETSSKIELKPGEVLAFIEGYSLSSLDRDIRILQAKDSLRLIAGPLKAIKGLKEDARMFIQLIEPSKLEPQECLESAHLDKWETANRENLFKRQDLKRPFLAPLTIDGQFLTQTLREFSGDLAFPLGKIPERGSAKGREAGQTYLKNQFAKVGLQVEEQCFSAGAYKGCNIIGVLPGKTEALVVVSAHADSVNNAGADDNGTGVSALLAIAKSMKQKTWNSTIQFVAFDLEEKGLLGSKAYVKDLVKLKKVVKGNINLEMLGYDSDDDGAFHVIDCQRKESASLVSLVKKSSSENNSLKVIPHCTNRSDHASFWNAGIPAVVISENFFDGDGNPCYHESCDKFDKINTNYYLKLTDLVGRVTAQFSDAN